MSMSKIRRRLSWKKQSSNQRSSFLPRMETLEERIVLANDFYRVPGVLGETVRLQFDLTGKGLGAANELDVYLVDDTQGRVNGILPSQIGYAAAAATRAQSIFSMTTTVGARQALTAQGGQLFGFLLVKKGTLAQWSQVNPDNLPSLSPLLLFSADAANPQSRDAVKASLQSVDTTLIKWEDSTTTPGRLFNDNSFTVKPVRDAVLQIPGQVGQTVSANFSLSLRDASYRNELGLIVVDNAQGAISGVLPGDPAYAKVALSSSSRQVIFSSTQGVGSTRKITLPSQSYVVFYMVQNTTTANFLARNPDNLLNHGPMAFFSITVANRDRLAHQKWFNFKSFGFEDLYGGGDRDYNDILVQFAMDNPTGPVVPPETTPPVISAALRTDTAPGGATNTDGVSSLVDIQGIVTDQSRITSFRAGLDNATQQQLVDITSRLNSGAFILDRTLLNQLAGGTLTQGTHTLKLLATDQYNNTSSLFTLPFVLDSQVALSVQLDQAFDTPPVGDLITSFSTITLAGMTDPGATVQLVGTSRSAVADSLGKYQLTGITLTTGNNPFTVKAIDVAGNELTRSISIAYNPPDDCDFDDQLTGWRIEEQGGSQAGKGTVTVGGGSATIHEGDSYLVSLSKEFTIPAGDPSQLDIEFSLPQFDTTAINQLKDAFEVAYVDANGQTLVLPFFVTRDAYFNITEGQNALYGAGTELNNNVLSVNLAGLTAGTSGRLYLRLFNNDSDTQTQVTIHCVMLNQVAGLTPAAGVLSRALVNKPTPAVVDLNNLTTVNSSVVGEYGRSSYFASTSTLYSTVALHNTGTYGIGGPVLVVIDHLTDPTVIPQGVDGFLPDGRAYYNFTPFFNNGKLEPGQTSGTHALQFYTPSGKPFTYSLTILAQPNRAPAFTTEALPDVAPGRTYVYNANAVDPDGDAVAYQLLTGPVGLIVNAATGQVTWTPTSDQVGNHDVMIEANDGRGGTSTQRFTIAVRTNIPNRPPVITSTPVVDANVKTSGTPAYQYDVEAYDPDFDPLTFTLVNSPMGMTINPTTGVITWSPNDSQLGNNPVVVRASDGKGGQTEQSFTVTVRSAVDNHAPLIISEPPATQTSRSADGTYLTSFVSGTAPAGRLYSYPVSAVDSDGDTLTFSLLDHPDGMTIDAKTGLIQWSAKPADVGQHLVLVQTGDGRGGRDVQRFIIDVVLSGGTISGTKFEDISWQGTVPGIANPWLAGMPDGATALFTDVAPAQSPVLSGLSVTPGQVLTFNVTGTTSNLPTGGVGPDGQTFILHSGENGIGDIVAPLSSFIGVFLTDTRPNLTGIPGSLNFSPGSNVPGGIDYTSLSPLLKQPFFIGDGHTSGGLAQQIVVPAGATRLFLGTMDGVDWNNNSGSLDVTVSTVTPLPSILLNEGDFSPATWTIQQGPLFDGNPSLSGPTIVNLEHRTSGGNPNDYQYERYFYRVGDFVSVIGSGTSMTYNPQTQGAINSIDASIDITQFHVEEPGQFPAGSVWKVMIEQNGVRYYDTQLRIALNNFGAWPTFTVTGLQAKDFDTNVMVGFGGGAIPADPTGQHPDFSANGAPMTFGIVDCNAGSGPQGAPLSGAFGLDNFQITIARLKPKDGLAGFVVYLDQNNNGARDPGERYQITDGQGSYQFTDLPQGTYIVREEAQPIASQSFLYSDGDFTPANWQDATVFLRDGNPSLSGPTVVGPSLRTTGGNPGNFRYQADDFRVGDLVGTSSINTSTSYNPQVQGAIATIDFAMDAIQFPPVLSGQGPGGTAYTPALMQNGIVYFGTPFGNSSTTWKNYTVNGMTAADFDTAIIPEERLGNHPDFSAYGSPIFLGYGHWITGGGSSGFRLLNEFGADNWEMTIHNIGQTGLWEQSIPANPGYYSVDLSIGEVESGKDFGNRRKADAGPVFTSEPLTIATVNGVYRYNVEANGVGGLQFDLPQRPAGMAIDPVTGVIVWRPGEEQEGIQTVVVRVRDGEKRVALQSFTVDVRLGNTPPVFTSEPTRQAVIGRPWQYRATAIDADQDMLTFTLDSGPTGLTISSNGVVNWTPTSGQLGSQAVQLRVNDGHGGETIQLFTLNVVSSTVNTDPVITGTPRTTVRVGDNYLAQFTAHDAEGDPLTFSLPIAPTGMSIDVDGKIHFVATSSQLGAQQVTVRVEDGQGGSAEMTFTLNVVGQETNHTPVITSTPPGAATVGRMLQYAPTFDDADGDPVVWSILSGPPGLAIDPLTGMVRWRPSTDQLGPQTVVLQATDPKLASTTQSFTITVRGSNTPPLVLSSAVTEAAANQPYEYRVRAQDAEGDTLTYALPIAPAGMVINQATGIITWTPGSDQIGSFSVQVTASDGQGGLATQNYMVIVSGTSLNRPPVITSPPVLKASVARLYQYQVTATDPEGDALVYALLSGPVGMAINTTTGLVSWTPTTAQLGAHLVTIGARDASGIYGQQTFRITIIENQAPVINTQPVITGLPGTLYRYDVGATDPDGDTLTYSLTQFQAGMTIDQSGRISWNVPLAQGTVPITVSISDGRGGVASQTYNITITGDTQAPQVNAQINPNPAPLGSLVLIQVAASDNDRIASLVLYINGEVVPLAADGTAHYEAVAIGSFPVQVVAVDAAGNMSTYSTNIVVNNVADPTGMGPEITFDSPNDQAEITGPTDIIGSIVAAPGNTVASWTISLGQSNGEFRQIGQGIGPLTNGVFTQLDPTTLANDAYILRVIARDEAGHSSYQDLSISIQGPLKLGQYRKVFTDITIPLAGIPIQIDRIYDTQLAGQKGDFGYGWQLGLFDPKIHETVPSNIGEGFFGPISAPFKVGTKVYLTAPDGHRVGFTFKPEQVDVLFFGTFWRPRFVPDPGVLDTLDALTDPTNFFGDLYQMLPDGSFTRPMSIFGGTFNPDTYHLTAQDGTVYTYDQTAGLQKIVDANNNVITITAGGISSSTGASIVFHRDGQGRITEIVDPAGHSLKYQYDAAGNLVTRADQVGSTMSYTYYTNPSHFLKSIVDGEGNTVFQAQFDAQGRLIASIDALGNSYSNEYDTNALTEAITDAQGNKTLLAYDEQGNIISTTLPTTAVTSSAFDEHHNIITQTNAVGVVTRMTYDERGNRTSVTVDGKTWRFTYTSLNKIATATDPLGNVNTYLYDSIGNLLKIIDPLGNSTVYTYDSQGHQLTVTDTRGNTTEATYGSGSKPLKVTNPDGTFVTVTYNEFGQPLTLTDELGFTSFFQYDDAGRKIGYRDALNNLYQFAYNDNNQLITQTDALGRITRYVYDKAGNLSQIVDPLGHIAENHYDELNRVIESISVNGHEILYTYRSDGLLASVSEDEEATTSYEYDLAGNQTATIDPNGHRTQFAYDALNQVISQTNALGGVQHFTYDAAGNLTAFTDENGHTTQYAYDAAGQVIRETDPLGNVTSYSYDSAGNRIKVIDALGRITTYDFNFRNHLISRTNALGGVFRFTYDAIGTEKTTTDEAGRTTTMTHDALRRMVAVTDPAGQITRFGYDAVGNQISLTDPLGNITNNTYDALDRLTVVTDALGGLTRYTYDNEENLLTTTDPLGRVTSNEYDHLERVIKTIDPAGKVTGYTYDLGGNLTSVTDPLNQTTSFEFDALNRVVKRTDPNGSSNRFTYDAVGNLTRSIDRNNKTRNFSYDADDRVVQEQWMLGVTPVRTISYSYDAVGNLLQATDPDSAYTVAYDDLNRIVTVDNQGTPNVPRTVLNYTYDAVGNPTSITDNNNVKVTMTYDPRDLLKTIIWQGGGVTPARADIGYNARGERVSLTRFADISGTVPVVNSVYVYDALGRLNSLAHKNSANVTLAGYGYTFNAASELTSDTINGQTTNYSYDTAGQLTSATHTGQPNETYSYDAAGNRNGGSYVVGQNNQISSDGVFNYYYDDQGNLVQKQTIATNDYATYVYDYRGRLTLVEQRNANGDLLHSSSFVYDVFDRRIEVKADGVVTRTVYTGDAPWVDFNGSGTVTARYLIGPKTDEMLARYKPSSGTAWYLTDWHGSVRDITNSSGTIIDHITYDSFGSILTESNPSQGDRFKFAGREFDTSTGLYYYRARYYDAQLGRFISQDPIGFESGDTNLYRYVSNSPTNYRDPSGNSAILESTVRFLYIPSLVGGLAYDCCMIKALATASECNPLSGNTIRECVVESLSAAAVTALVGGGLAYGAAYKVSAVASLFIKTSKVLNTLAATSLAVKVGADVGTAISKPSAGNTADLICDALSIGTSFAGPPKPGSSNSAAPPLAGACFTAGTQVLMGDFANSEDEETVALWQQALGGISLVIGVAGMFVIDRQARKRQRDEEEAVDQCFNTLCDNSQADLPEPDLIDDARMEDQYFISLNMNSNHTSKSTRIQALKQNERDITPADQSFRPNYASAQEPTSVCLIDNSEREGKRKASRRMDDKHTVQSLTRRWLEKNSMVLWGLLAFFSLFTVGHKWFSRANDELTSARHTQNIENIRVGQRVHTNQDVDSFAGDNLDINPTDWRLIHLRMPIEGTEAIYEIRVLRPLNWLLNLNICENGSIPFELDEIGVRGSAKIVSIEGCPPIQVGKGRLVLGTIVSQSDQVLEITLAGSEKPLQPTQRHLLYSATRNDWVPAGKLKVGEQLRTQSGLVSVLGIRAKPEKHQVYNLEVEKDHRYFVADSRVLSHNTGANPCAAGNVKEITLDYKVNKQDRIEFERQLRGQEEGLNKLSANEIKANIEAYLQAGTYHPSPPPFSRINGGDELAALHGPDRIIGGYNHISDFGSKSVNSSLGAQNRLHRCTIHDAVKNLPQGDRIKFVFRIVD